MFIVVYRLDPYLDHMGSSIAEGARPGNNYGKRPNNSNTLIIQTPLNLSHFGN
jgi:hypothetical protein